MPNSLQRGSGPRKKKEPRYGVKPTPLPKKKQKTGKRGGRRR